MMHTPTVIQAAALAVALLAAGAILVADRPSPDPRRRRIFPRLVITASILSIATNITVWIQPQPWPVLLLLGAGGVTLVYAAHRRIRALATTRQHRPRR